MTTGDLAIELRGVVNLFAAAAQALLDGDLTTFKIRYAAALRELDSFQDAKSGASL
jgi:hypothetical protein